MSLSLASNIERVSSAIDPALPLSDLPDFDYRGWEGNKTTEARIVHEIEGRFTASYDESRFMRQHDWRRNWEFAAGNQWSYWNDILEDFVALPIPEELKYTENQFRGTMRQGLNMMVQGDPAYDTAPVNSDWESRQAAIASKPYLFSKAREFNLGRLRAQNVQDAILFGFGIRKVYWRKAGGGVDVVYRPKIKEEAGAMPQAYGPEGNDAEVEPALHARTGEALIDKIAYTGKLCQEATSPWMWFPQPGREMCVIDDMDYCIEANFVSPAWVERAFPGIKIGPEDLERINAMPYQLLQPGDLNWNALGSTQNRRPPLGKVLMLTYYQIPAPRRGHEHGVEISICGSHVLYTGRLQTCSEKPPYDGPLPFALFAYESRRGTFYPRPPASDWVEPQMRINQILSDQYTYADLCSRPNLLTTEQDGTPDVVSFGLERWKIKMGFNDPRFLVPPPMPAQFFALKADAERALDRVSMLFGATRGERSQSDPSGYYLDVLREHDQIDLQISVRDHAQAEERAGSMTLLLGKKFEPDEQWLQLEGRNGKPRLYKFLKEKLRPDKVRVVVQATSLLPSLVSSRKRTALESYEKGLFGPPGQVPPALRRKLIKWIDAPDLYESLDLEEVDEHLADRVHSWIIDDQRIPIPPGLEADAQALAQQAQQTGDQGAMQQAQQAAQAAKKAQGLIASERAFIVDSDWDPNILLEFAIDRKKEDDQPFWPDRAKQLFEQYLTILKQAQQQMAQQQQQQQLAQAEAQLALESKYTAIDQESQAKGRTKTHLVDAVAKAMLTPHPEHQATAEAKMEIVKGFAQHLMQWSLAEEPGGRAGKPGGRDSTDTLTA